MKGQTREYPYTPLTGLNPFQEEIVGSASTLKHIAEQIGVLGRLQTYFAGFAEITSDDISGISAYSTSVTFALAVKDSRFVHKLAQYTGLDFVKGRNYDGKSLRFDAKPERNHPLAELGITLVTVTGYLPQTCKTVIKEYTPLDEAQAEVYRELLEKGRPVYETTCEETVEETPIEVPVSLGIGGAVQSDDDLPF